MVPRAFHSAYQLESTLPQHASILLVGGLAPKDGLEATAVALKDVGNYLDIAPTGTAAGAGILDLDLERMSSTTYRSTGPSCASCTRPPTAAPAIPCSSAESPPEAASRSCPGARRPGVPRPGGRPLARVGRAPRRAPSGRDRHGDRLLPGREPGLAGRRGEPVGRRRRRAPAHQIEIRATAPGASGPPTSATTRLVEEVSLSRLEDLVHTAFHTATPLVPGPHHEAVLVAGGFVLAPAAPLPKMVATEPLGPDAGASPLPWSPGTAAMASPGRADSGARVPPRGPPRRRAPDRGTVLLSGGSTS